MEHWSKENRIAPARSTRRRKSRHEKPHIELAPDQPPTTQGKPRERVYVACVQCRFARGYPERLFEEEDIKKFNIAAEPSLDLYRKTWWDCLLATYATSFSCADPMSLSATDREQAATLITADLRFLFRTTISWMSFIHVPRFFSTFFNPITRANSQPSLIIMACALSIFLQSSELGRGKAGRELALQLRDQAEGALQASLNAGWIDENLAIAAWMLAMFENSGHPEQSIYRSFASMHALDKIIRTLSLTTIDENDPNASTFALREVPRVMTIRHPHMSDSADLERETSPDTHEGCDCASLSLGHQWTGAFEHTPLWLSTPAWNDNWTEGEFKKETCRRLCWSTVILATGISSYTTARQTEDLDLFVTEPANACDLSPCFALLFPGESSVSSKNPKNSIWALNYRTMFLWNSCVRMRRDLRATDAEKARFGMAAWSEVDERG
ncbi:hypothetical protein FIBSPDRAFT_816488 [Athelia psychrophila]|uniref:Transcription factor domain-containing protein n=1 Tax=Athelia psychrophila TaxID=1759441 RepID=A0A166S7X7_9AGAM|nr:hypothetical protein FIBSPDRAFT_816488 [Fibularhizoctonia sp. CBS 109695]